jgi:hypothetical protein
MRQLERQGASLSFRRAGSSKAMAENWDIPVAPMDWKKTMETSKWPFLMGIADDRNEAVLENGVTLDVTINDV